jgi:hypothetical protein
LQVFFNTTVHDGNLDDIPAIVRFLIDHCDVVRFASFQLQAETGRGLLGGRGTGITMDAVAQRIAGACGTQLTWNAPRCGHRACNASTTVLVAGGDVVDLYDDAALVARGLARSRDLVIDRRTLRRAVIQIGGWMIRHPELWRRGLPWAMRKAWQLRHGLVRARGRLGKITFFLHNFMDAGRLELERVQACSFMVMTADGAQSMCVFNARRDEALRRKIPVGDALWDPLTGAFSDGSRSAPERRRVVAKGRAAP